MTRRTERQDFLEHAGWGSAVMSSLAGDASFRTYFRLDDDIRQAVLMDAPPPDEDVQPFIAIANHLRSRGFSAPEIVAAEIDRGFLILEDLGDQTFNRVLAASPNMERTLYQGAVDFLISLHGDPAPSRLMIEGESYYDLPPYDLPALLGEAQLFTDWYLPEIGSNPENWQSLAALLTPLLEEVIDAEPILTLRDYHVDNLMWLPDRDGISAVGPLDFQDALAGHPAYDLVSLLRDARRDVPEDLEQAMISRYLAARDDFSKDQFDFAYALLGVQRNTKIIGIFTRLWKRDGKPGYLRMIPHVWGLLDRSLAHPAFEELKSWFDRNAPVEKRQDVLVPGGYKTGSGINQ